VGELLELVSARAARHGLPGLDVRTAFLDHAAPALPRVLEAVAGEHDRCVVVPLLLTAAFHTKTDIPGQVAAERAGYPLLDVGVAEPLGPHPLLVRALERRLAAAHDGPRPATGVVLAAAGSSDPAANATIAAIAASWQESGGWRRVIPAYASASSPTPAEAVRELSAGGPVAVATYLLAPGFFADRVRATALAAGASAASDALGALSEVADVVLERYADAARGECDAPLAAEA
jgi:sirohydrochlorin ferrochelatase